MSEVSFTVGGRNYTVACAPGEEAKVAALGAHIDGKLDQLGGNLAPQESQNLLFAALLLADELQETKADAASTETLREELKQANDRAAAASAEGDTLRREAERLAGELKTAGDAASGTTPAPAPAPASADPNLAPALERFAEMLEDCADKLEGKAAAS